jgi:hypothetical protein
MGTSPLWGGVVLDVLGMVGAGKRLDRAWQGTGHFLRHRFSQGISCWLYLQY